PYQLGLQQRCIQCSFSRCTFDGCSKPHNEHQQQKYLCNRHGHDGDAALILPHRDFHQPQKDCAASRLRLIDCPNSCRCVLAFETLPLKFSTAGAASETWRSSCCVLADVSANVCASRAADSRKGVTASSILLLNASDGT